MYKDNYKHICHRMVGKYAIKICTRPFTLIFGAIIIKNAMSYQLTPVRRTIIKIKKTNRKNV